jgi:hypothetical protein
MKYECFYSNEICFLNLEKLDKEELDFINQMPFGHSIPTDFGHFRKTGVFDINHPQRVSLMMILLNDYIKTMNDPSSKLREIITI